VDEADDPTRLSFEDGRFDLVVDAGAIQRVEWDRWALQEIHRVLKPGGRLVAWVPNILALRSPQDVAFLLSRAAVFARRRVARAMKRMPPVVRFHTRKYRIGRFLEMLPALGFLRIEVAEKPSPAPWVAGWVVQAVKGPAVYGQTAERPWPDPAAHRARYERAHADFIASRDAWLGVHLDFANVRPVELDPAAYAGARVLALAPHPDDEVIGCGGTLLRLVKAGARVTVLQATDGSESAALLAVTDETRRTIRLDEAAAVGRAMGFEEVVCWKEDNRAFRAHEAAIQRMRELLDRLQPALIFTPFVADIHPDHGTLNRILARALENASNLTSTNILQYEVWGLVPANVYCVVTDEVQTLEKILRLYHTAMKVDDFVHFCEERNLYHALVHTGRPGWVEAFLQSTAEEFRRMAADPG